MDEVTIRNRERVVVALRAACLAHPEQRVVQVVINALGTDPFYVEDQDAETMLYAYARVGRQS